MNSSTDNANSNKNSSIDNTKSNGNSSTVINIRVATKEDAKELLAIYAPYVERTAISFEYTVPTLEEFTKRIDKILMNYPYLVAERAGEIVGYTYAAAFKERKAYNWAVETTIYIKGEYKHLGIGKLLYEALEQALKKQNILNLNAGVAYADTEDEYLTQASIHFHEQMGYQQAARFHQCGYKFGKWYDLIWMEKQIGTHGINPPAVIPFSEII